MNIPVYLNIAGLQVYENIVPNGQTKRDSDSKTTESKYSAEETHLCK